MRVAFISTMAGTPWGGSEILWSRAAELLIEKGVPVTASVASWPVTPTEITHLQQLGVSVQKRPDLHQTSLVRSVKRRLFGRRLLLKHKLAILVFKPTVVCISQGCILESIKWMQWCVENSLIYVVITQANAEKWWPVDSLAERMADLHSRARYSCFVSHGNLDLFERQIGKHLENAKVIWNPYQVSVSDEFKWPEVIDGFWKLACVGRLDPQSKGQDLFFKVMSEDKWRSRPIIISLFGTGPNEESLRRLAKTYDIENQIEFCGHVSNVDEIWDQHHALLLTSRYEGMPLVLLEAMMRGRPSIVTDVAGNAEVIEDGISGYIAKAPTVELVSEAMERAWQDRSNWQKVGQTAARNIRLRIPEDPARQFNELLERVNSTDPNPSQC